MARAIPPISPGTLLSAAAVVIIIGLCAHAWLSASTRRTAALAPVELIAPPPAPPPLPPVQKEEEPPPPELSAANDAPSLEPGSSEDSPGPAPADPSLGLAGEGEAGGDAFGLAAKPKGRELLLTGGGGGGGREDPAARYVQFAGQLQAHIQRELNQVEELRHTCYTLTLDLRMSGAGVPERIRIAKSSGDARLDARVRTALESIGPFPQEPPADMPWPVRLRVVARGSCRNEPTAVEGSGSRPAGAQ